PKEYADALYPPIPEVNWHFQIDVDGKETQFMSYLEVDKQTHDNPDALVFERKYYAPLKP
ncbi:MAG: hypothetical protein FWF96_02500, partial [Kiritimatiellaeota bacterium]|nr:hypothetical protein [Kiritimatiellota bacterium]